MNTAVEIIPFESSYLNQTLDFLRANTPDHPELGDKGLFEWQQCSRYLALFKGEIVGHIAQMPHKFYRNNEAVEVGWGITLVLDMSNFMVKTFAGTALLDKIIKNPVFTYAAVGIVPEIEQTYVRRGYPIRRDCLKMYARFFEPGKALKYLKKPGVYSIAVRTINIFYPARKAHDDSGIVTIDQFKAEWDNRWNELLAGRYEFYGERTAQFLNYKLAQPHKTYIAMIYKNTDGSVDGYIVYRLSVHNTRDMRLVRICDLVGTDAARNVLLDRAVAFGKKSDAYGIVALSSAEDSTLFKKHGLWLARDYPIVVAPGVKERPQVTLFDSDLDDLW